MNDWVKRIEANILRRQLLRKNEAVLVAVSGGLDSMVLLHVLHQLAAKHSWKLHVAHFNHQLRGRSSDADERFVRKFAEKLNLPISVGQGNVRQVAKENKQSVEMAARQLRHEFFARIAKENRLRKVALAHHADDQVELFFLRLQRGSGTEALAGMKWKSSSPANAKICLIRPLLDQPKERLQKFAAEQRILFREDASNTSTEFLRNRIRSEIIPVLRNQNPPIFQTVLRSMGIIGAESEFVADAARLWRKEMQVPFAELHIALQRRILHDQLVEAAGRVSPSAPKNTVLLDFELIERLRQFPKEPFSVAPNLSISRDENGKVHLQKFRPRVFFKEFQPIELGQQGKCVFGGFHFFWKIERHSKRTIPKLPCTEFFDADNVGQKIELRHWQPGDRFQPIGSSHQVKLQDWFVNLKIPAAERRKKLVAIAENGEIFWVEGVRISERFKLGTDTLRQLKWAWKSA